MTYVKYISYLLLDSSEYVIKFEKLYVPIFISVSSVLKTQTFISENMYGKIFYVKNGLVNIESANMLLLVSIQFLL